MHLTNKEGHKITVETFTEELVEMYITVYCLINNNNAH